MNETKLVSTRLPQELLNIIDEKAEKANLSRSAALRFLIERGLDNNSTNLKINELQRSIERVAAVSEYAFLRTHMAGTMLAADRAINGNTVKGFTQSDFEQTNEMAKKALQNLLIKKFGE